VFYTATHHHPDLVLYLRERKSLSLQQMFVDAEEVEDNLRACGNLLDQVWDEDLEQEQVYEQHKLDLDAEDQKEAYEHEGSDMGSHLFQRDSASFSDFYSSSDLEIITSYFSTVEDADVYDLDCHEKDFAEGDDVFVSEKVVSPQRLVVDIGDQLSFLAYDDLQDYIFSSFSQAFYLHAENQHFEEYSLACTFEPEKFQTKLWEVSEENYKQSMGESPDAILEQKYDINNGADLIQRQPFFLDQPKIFHEFYDPIATWMEFSISKISNAVEFGVLPDLQL
jgi:hypothetical protein